MLTSITKIILLLLINCSLFINKGLAQNLVPNPSFEDTVFCPYAESQMPLNWLLFGNSADYLNACSSALNVPNTPTGYHEANSGDAMIGLFTYVSPSNPSWPDYREYVGVQLTNPLVVGQNYYMSFFLNFGGFLPNWQQIGADKLGMKFSTISYSENTPPTLNNFAHLYTDSIYSDTNLWTKVSGSFIADSAYNYVMIGNFFDEIQTDTLIIVGPPFGGSGAYYYIDDICVSTDSSTCNQSVSINHFDNEVTINIFPNPVQDYLNINAINETYDLTIFNSLGQVIFMEKNVRNTNKRVSTNQFDSGLLFINIKTKNLNLYYKSFKT